MKSGDHDPAQRAEMLRVARASIAHGLETGRPLSVDLNAFEAALREPRASFVTLNRNGRLRGCIGMLEAQRPLIEDIAENAFAAAFKDPRFAALSGAEFADLRLHIAVLSPSEPLEFRTQTELLQQLRPGVDGLILIEGPRRGTFLPSVWEQLPEPASFLAHLKQKAGLPADYWSATLRARRYTSESFS